MRQGLWLVVGVQAAGKSTIADLLARQFERGVHIRGGQYYRWAVRGWVHAGDQRADEARRLLELRYRLAAFAADEYCAAGFTTVVQDNIFGADVLRWLTNVAARPRHLIVLRPSVAVVRQREEQRFIGSGKVAYRPDGFTPEDLDRQLAATPRIASGLTLRPCRRRRRWRRSSAASPRPRSRSRAASRVVYRPPSRSRSAWVYEPSAVRPLLVRATMVVGVDPFLVFSLLR